MRSIYFPFLLLLVLCFSCQNNEHEQLLLETQQAYLEELGEKEELMWDALKTNFHKNEINYSDFNQLESYREKFRLALDNPSKDKINQLVFFIDSLKQEVLQNNELENINFTYSDENVKNEIALGDYQIELLNTHCHLLRLLINYTSTLHDKSYLKRAFVMFDASIIQDGETFKADIFVMEGLYSKTIQKIYFGKYDKTKLVDSLLLINKPYSTKDENDIPLHSYHMDSNHKANSLAKYSQIDSKVGEYSIEGVVQVDTYQDKYEFYPFQFSYEVVDCP